MTYLGEVIESKIEDDIPIVKLKTLDGIFEVAFFPNANTVSRPEVQSIVLCTKGSQSNEYVAHSGISKIINSQVEAGEYLIFSTDNNQIKSFIHLKKNGDIAFNGNIIFNGGTDYAVKYSELSAKLIQLQNQITDLTRAHNVHVHPYVGSPPVAMLIINPIANFEEIKVDKVRL